MNRRTQFDSHPSARQRIEWAERVALAGDRPSPDDLEPVWALFPDPERLERDMTAIIRERVCRGARWLGVELDVEANNSGGPRISAKSSCVSVWIIPTNEELMIAHHTRRVIGAATVAA